MPQHKKTAIRASNAASNNNHIVFQINTHNPQLPRRGTGTPIPPRHLHPLDHPSRISTHTDGTTMTMNPLNTMSRALPSKVMPLHHTRKAATLTRANHVNMRRIRKDTHINSLTNTQAVLFTVSPKLTNKTRRLTTRLSHQFHTGGHTLPLTHSIQHSHMATLGTRRQTARLILKPQLHTLIAIATKSPQLQHRTRSSLNDSHGNNLPVVTVDLRHSYFATQ